MRIVVSGADGKIGRRPVSAATSAGDGTIALVRAARVLWGRLGSMRRVQLVAGVEA